ncbi:hypothetical protein D9M71_136940 [compost metagenome]
MVEHETGGAHQHDGDFAQLDQADQGVLGVFFAKLPGQRGKQEKRQDEQQCTQVDPDRAVALDGQLVKDGEDQRLLEDIVVEGAQQLRNEKRQEAPLAQQSELRLMTHRPCTCMAPRSAKALSLECRCRAKSHIGSPDYLNDPWADVGYFLVQGAAVKCAMHGDTNSSPRQAPLIVRVATINHMAARAATSTSPKPLKKPRCKVWPKRSVASA